MVKKTDFTDAELKALSQNGKIISTKDTGKGAFLGGFMTEGEVAQSFKENELGWKKVFDKVRNLGKE